MALKWNCAHLQWLQAHLLIVDECYDAVKSKCTFFFLPCGWTCQHLAFFFLFFFFNNGNYFQGLLEELHLIYWVLAPREPAQIAGFMGCNDPYRNTLLPSSYRETVRHLQEPWGANGHSVTDLLPLKKRRSSSPAKVNRLASLSTLDIVQPSEQLVN